MKLSLGRRGMIAVVMVTTALVALTVIPNQPAAVAAPILDGDMLDLINNERAAHGLGSLTRHWDLEDDASGQTGRQVARGTIFHTADLTKVVTGDWASIGENVGVGPSIPLLHDAFMDSPGHRANILGDWSHIGISAKKSDSGQTYITVIFMRVRGSVANAEPLTSLPMLTTLPSDSSSSIFANDIAWLAQNGSILGCSANSYCPDRPVTRGEMATLMATALDLPATSTDFFSDDDGSPHEANINRVAAARITVGCNPPANTYFCEQETLTRQQMASFFVRALQLPTDVPDRFGDDTNSVHEANINALGASGITRGCNPPSNDKFCPQAKLTRGQVAAFLARALR